MRWRRGGALAYHGVAVASALCLCLAQLASFVLQNPYQIPSPWLRAALAAGMCVLGARFALPALIAFFLLIPVSGFVHLILGLENTALETMASALYLGFAVRRCVRGDLLDAEAPAELTASHGLIILSACSVLAALGQMGPGLAAYRIVRTQPLDQLDPLFVYRAGLCLTLALCLFEMVRAEAGRWLDSARLTGLLTAQAVLIAACAAVQLLFQYPLPRLPGLFAPFADVHSFAGYALVLFVFFLASGLGGPGCGKFHPSFAFGLSGLFFGFIFLSNSRSSWLVAAGAVAAAIVSRLPRKKALAWLVGAAACLALAGTVFLGATKDYGDVLGSSMRHNLIVRARNLILLPADFLAGKESGEVKTLNDRVSLWERAAELGAARPMTGVGIGSFYARSAWTGVTGKEAAPGIRQNAHNWYLQMFAELGLPGLALVAWLFWLCLGPALARRGGDAARALAFGLVAYLASCLAGHHLIINTQEYLVFMLMAGLSSMSPPGPPQPRLRAAAVAAVALAVVCQGYLAVTAESSSPTAYGLYGRESGDPLGRRWSMRRFGIQVTVTDGVMLLEFQGAAASLPGGRQRLALTLGGDALGEAVFEGAASRRLCFDVRDKIGQTVTLAGELDQAFNPATRGAGADNRDLGVLLGEVLFLPACPAIPGNP